jgi:hypothetical protein
MFDKRVVHEAIMLSLATGSNSVSGARDSIKGEDSIISLLIHDIFGGDIMKSQSRKRWHFYNLINGERIDFARRTIKKPVKTVVMSDVQSSPEETQQFVDVTDYSIFTQQFIRIFEEITGLRKPLD